jgi:hypothetical protein
MKPYTDLSSCTNIKAKTVTDKQVQTDLHSTDVFFAEVLQGKNDLVICTVQLSKKQNYQLEEKTDMKQWPQNCLEMDGETLAMKFFQNSRFQVGLPCSVVMEQGIILEERKRVNS